MEYVNEENLRTEIINIQKSNRLKKIAEEMTDNPSEKLIKEKESILLDGYTEKYSKTKFGEMILQIVKRRATSSKFSGYTYKEEFYSNAIEKIMLYAINNFKHDYINPKTGKGSKAFSYITEIASRAFITIINEYRDEQIEINNLISYESLYQHTQHRSDNKSTYDSALNSYSIFLKLEHKNNMIYNGEQEYDSIYSLLKEYEGKYIKVEYPMDYNINMTEYDKIKELKFDYLDLSKVKIARYIPSFPKKELKVKENLTEEWI